MKRKKKNKMRQLMLKKKKKKKDRAVEEGNMPWDAGRAPITVHSSLYCLSIFLPLYLKPLTDKHWVISTSVFSEFAT